ncbi:MAG TPA: hypothetical protein VFZ78_10715 [Flavisolibacter sp.]
MKNVLTLLQQDCLSELHAQKAIRKIYRWLDENYPLQPAMTKSLLIRQVLAELDFERKVKTNN